MTYLLIDAGNSRLKLLVKENATNSEILFKTLDYNNLYDDFIDLLSKFSISSAVISNVSNHVYSQVLSDAIYRLWNIKAHIVVSQQNKFGISTLYANPCTLGSDRWLTLIAAKSEFKNHICVIDCGTAVTIDVLTKKGIHIGGFITPGLKLSLDALGQNTNNLPDITDNPAEKNNQLQFLATNTEDGIYAGTLCQLSSYVENIITQIKTEISENIKCIITGGDAIIVQNLVSHSLIYREKLVLNGLDIVSKDLSPKDPL